MASVVLDASAVLALVRDEPGADKVAPHVGRAAISAVNLQEVIKELLLSGLDEATTRELLDELRFDVRAHDVDAAYAAAGLHAQTRQYGRSLGDRSCLALAMQLGVPALTGDREWKKVKVKGLRIELIRS
ncbi:MULTISPECIES: type II toxin-antitoxin system VapC family toxin [Sphingomonas]|jgi:ribonuclease VapC|uniref:type II toxin-antitoxin system VapC family toxin n=1 Tax=Sphingomonas TaxID=13687 RepID=UPI000DBBBC0C|nr:MULTISPECIES: type II toxin-antitoxin system VapC family toxin [Sphingomonas]MDG5973513.1 type II toxin-antitoxin system VapC family toxin [Sphingomonas paucimobilis]PZT90485.1 MAG: VapC toxin family PIN domain ribonuclease [Sphingomonas sp.]